MDCILTLDQIIPRAARLYADKTAFKYLKQSITYRELDDKTNQLANYLLAKGLTKGDRVGVFLPRCIEIPIAIYGILKAGAAFVPLDSNMPVSRLDHIIKDCQITMLVCAKSTTKKIEALLATCDHLLLTIGLEEKLASDLHQNVTWNELEAKAKKEAPGLRIMASDLAYIMYTSGTTGVPKGIMHTHYSGLSYARLSKQQYDVIPDDVIANHSPLHFDISTFGYLSSPLACATTVIISEGHTKFPMSLAQLIKKEAITIWYSVPIALIQLSNLDALKTMDIRSVRWVLFGGESYPTKDLLKLMAIWPNAQYSNVYGPAEVNQCTFYTVPKTIDEASPIPLGHVWPDTDMLILDDDDNPVASGELGKLLISSSTMMYGYWNNDELSEKGFYYSASEKMKNFTKRYYRTGDLVRLTAEGLLLFYGRGDRQIKTRGYRVELNEVESALQNISEIKKAAVFAYTHPDFGKLIGASIVLNQNSIMDKNKIRNLLAQALPKYCIPEKINFVESLQRTSAGKVDYKQLSLDNNEV
ncbi:MAG: amino acid adenylation domain-containing protein [Bacteroidota bacterium]